jgi:selenocysteine lyase/cysteine desulfurase
VAAAIEGFRHELDRDPEGTLLEHQAPREAAVYEAAAAYTGGASDELALTDSTTMGLGLLYRGLKLSPGDEILTSTQDFYSTHESLRLRGGAVRKIQLYRRPESASTDEIVSAVARAITSKTRVLALTWVHSSTGVRLPIVEIAKAIPDRVLFCVDGVHGFGNQDVDVARLGCDFLVSGCHKWLFGPRGTGLIWGRRSAWARTSATIPSFDGRAILRWLDPLGPVPVPPGQAMTPGGFHSFEHRWALAAAFGFNKAVGRARIAERTRSLATQLKAGLAELKNVTLHTPRSPDLSAGLVCFEIAGLDPRDAVDRLKQQRILASVTPYATSYVRFGPSIVNTPAEVETALRAIRALK